MMMRTVQSRATSGSSSGMTRRLAVISVLGFASGLPFALTDATLQAWLAVAEVDIETIGVFSLLTLPYVLKFIWAPVLDRFVPPLFGRRRAWMLISQLAIIVLLAALAARDPVAEIGVVALIALLLAFASATQDVAVDAFRAESLRPRERGLGAGLSVAGYRIATIVSGAGAFVYADRFGFNAAYGAAAAIMVVGLFASFAAKEPIADPPTGLREAIVEPFRTFFLRRDALAFVALIVLYKLGDAAAGRLSIAFLVRSLEFNLSEIGALYKGLGLLATLLGGVLGGALMIRFGLYRSLFAFALLQTLTNFGFVALSMSEKSLGLLMGVVGLENLSGGMGTAAFVALLIALCDRRYTATQFALLTGLASLGRVFSGPPAGVAVEMAGWTTFFFATVIVSLPVLILLLRMRSALDQLDVTDGEAKAS